MNCGRVAWCARGIRPSFELRHVSGENGFEEDLGGFEEDTDVRNVWTSRDKFGPGTSFLRRGTVRRDMWGGPWRDPCRLINLH